MHIGECVLVTMYLVKLGGFLLLTLRLTIDCTLAKVSYLLSLSPFSAACWRQGEGAYAVLIYGRDMGRWNMAGSRSTGFLWIKENKREQMDVHL